MPKRLHAIDQARTAASKIGESILDLITTVPRTDEVESASPRAKANRIRRVASAKALATAGSLALPPGPWGWLTILPELRAVWHIQAQMVADIAAAYGKSATLTREQIAYCLFRHTAAHAVREVVAQVGERFLVQKSSVRVLQTIARQVGIDVSQRSLSRVVSRWLPIIGAAGVGLYAYHDTSKVARTAIEFFGAEIELVDGPMPTRIPAQQLLAKKVSPAKPSKKRASKAT